TSWRRPGSCPNCASAPRRVPRSDPAGRALPGPAGPASPSSYPTACPPRRFPSGRTGACSPGRRRPPAAPPPTSCGRCCSACPYRNVAPCPALPAVACPAVAAPVTVTGRSTPRPRPDVRAGRRATTSDADPGTIMPTSAGRPKSAFLRALSGLTTRGRCLLAAGVAAAVCAAVLNERGLLRIAVFVVALPLLTVVLASASRVRIGARRVIASERVPVGGDGEVRLDLWRTGRLPAGEILVEDRVPQVLGMRPRFVVERLPHRPVSLRYPIRPGLRGVHRIGSLRATVTDPFGLCEFDRDLAPPSRIVVVPRVTPLHGLPGGAGAAGGEAGSVRLHAGQGEPDVMVRQYRTGDDMRKVHWRSTARRDEVMVRVEERPWRGGTTVLLDHRAAAHHGVGSPDGSLEWAIEFAASACLHLGRAGTPVRLVSGHGTPIVDPPQQAGPQADGVVLDALAALT